MEKKFFFLSGFARSGSTLLASILNQNPDVYVSPTSPLLDLYCNTEQLLTVLNKKFTFEKEKAVLNISKGLHHSFYADVNKKYIIDKSRGWTSNIDISKKIISNNPKVICTYRHLAECVASIVSLANQDPNNFIDSDLKSIGKPITQLNRATHIWETLFKTNYESFLFGLKNNRESIHLVEYDSLITNPSLIICGIYDFLQIENYKNHDYLNIVNTVPDDDEKWNMKNLHAVRPVLKKISNDPRKILGEQAYNYFDAINQQLLKAL